MRASDWLLRHTDAMWTPRLPFSLRHHAPEAEHFCDLFYLLTVANFDPKSASLIRTKAKINNYYTRADWKNRHTEESPEGIFRRTTWKVGVKIRRIRRFRELWILRKNHSVMDGWTDIRMDEQRENSISPTNTVCEGINSETEKSTDKSEAQLNHFKRNFHPVIKCFVLCSVKK